MQVSMYSTRGGARVALAMNQEAALKRAGLWQTLGYEFVSQYDGRPTYSDTEIAHMIRDYPRIARVGLFHPDFRPTATPFCVRNPRSDQPDAACAGFLDALNCATSVFGCDLVIVPRRDVQPDYHQFAEQFRVCMLVV